MSFMQRFITKSSFARGSH